MDRPDATTVARLLAHLQSGAGVQRFFSKATSSVWIPTLREHGVFSSPTPARREGSSVSFPRWPQAEYLARVTPQDPQQVAETIDAVPDTDNVWILRELATAIATMPWDLAERFLPRVAAWVRVPHASTLLVEPVSQLIRQGLEARRIDAVLPVITALFAIHEARPARRVEGLDDRAFDIPADAGGHLEPWQYRATMEQLLPALAAVDWRVGVDLLLALLDETLSIERGEDARRGGHDRSYIWYRRLTRSGEAPVEGAAETLVATLVSIADATAAETPDDLPELVDKLMGSPWGVAWRVALHVVAQCPQTDAPLRLIEQLLGDERLFSHADTRREYNQLLAAGFRSLSEEARRRILSWTQAKPAWMRDEDDATLGRWQRDRLAPLRGQLPKQLERHYATLVTEMGEPQFHEGLSGETVSWTGPTSPRSPAELAEMTVAEVLEFLRVWRPPGGWHSPTPEGLGRAVASDVEQRAGEYLALADAWADLPPTLARSVVVGIAAAVKAGQLGITRHAIERLAIITAAGLETDKEHQDAPHAVDALGDEDPSWAWFRREAVSLIEVAADRNAILEADAIQPALAILRAVQGDPDPTVEDEARFGSSMGPVTYAINTTRGQAVHSTIALLAWLHRNDGDAGSVGRALAILTDQLSDESPAVRSVFGMRLNQLASLHWEWLSERMGLVVSDDARGAAAWQAYVEWNRPWERTIPALWPHYRGRADEVAPGEAAPLLGHLLSILIAGIPAEGIRDVLTAAWSRASDESRAQCLHGLAQGFGQLTPEGIARARSFVAGRIEEIRRKPAEAIGRESAAMGWLFATGHLAPDDVVAWLPILVAVSPRLEREPELYELLASYVESGQTVVESVKCVQLLFQTDEGRWAAYAARGAIARTVNAALAHEGAAEQRAGRELRDYLLSTARFEPEWLENPPNPE